MLTRTQLETYLFFQDRPILSIEPVATQGYCNLNYKVTTDSQIYLVRKLLSSEVDREKEYLLQQQAAKLGIAPEIELYDRESQFMIMPFIDGKHHKELNMRTLRALIDTLSLLHKNLYFDEKSMDMKKLVRSRDDHIFQALEMIQNYPKNLVLCHNDLNPRNIVWQGDKPWLLDFEYAGVNDCYFDLAALSVEFLLSQSQEEFMLYRYFGGMFFQEKLDAYKVIYSQLCKEWFEKAVFNSTPS